jgi:DNA-directed RNA polymerase specialized sigma24 family protein
VTTLPQSDLDRFNVFYDELHERIINYIRNLTQSIPVDAEDLAQETWTRVWRQISAGNIIHVGYVYITARSVALDARRRYHRYLDIFNPLLLDLPIEDGTSCGDLIPDDVRDFTELVESKLSYRAPIERVLAELNTKQRVCLVLGAEGYRNDEIAQMYDWPLTTTKTSRNRGQWAFRAKWEKEEAGCR